jgi:hypothetical protein
MPRSAGQPAAPKLMQELISRSASYRFLFPIDLGFLQPLNWIGTHRPGVNPINVAANCEMSCDGLIGLDSGKGFSQLKSSQPEVVSDES